MISFLISVASGMVGGAVVQWWHIRRNTRREDRERLEQSMRDAFWSDPARRYDW